MLNSKQFISRVNDNVAQDLKDTQFYWLRLAVFEFGFFLKSSANSFIIYVFFLILKTDIQTDNKPKIFKISVT